MYAGHCVEFCSQWTFCFLLNSLLLPVLLSVLTKDDLEKSLSVSVWNRDWAGRYVEQVSGLDRTE